MKALFLKFVSGKGYGMVLARIAVFLLLVAGVAGCACCSAFKMPGESWHDALQAPTPELERLSASLKGDVESICALGPRNFESYANMRKGADLIETKFKEAGLAPYRVDYRAKPAFFARMRGATKESGKLEFSNVMAEIKGRELPDEIIVVGAHYDSVPFSGSLGADDNISGVAATLALARRFAQKPCRRTLRFIAFANEEPPFFWTDDMGSRVCAKRSAAAKERIVAMLTPECVGYYSDDPGSQSYPYPVSLFSSLKTDKGDFIAFVGNASSSKLVKDCVGIFRERCKFPSDGAAVPFLIPGVGWSDHWSYAKEGYPALMVTDTAFLRNRNYHTNHDDPAKLDYSRMAVVVDGLGEVIGELADR